MSEAAILSREFIGTKVKERYKVLVDTQTRKNVGKRVAELYNEGKSVHKTIIKDGVRDVITKPPKRCVKNINVKREEGAYKISYDVRLGFDLLKGVKIEKLAHFQEFFVIKPPNWLFKKYFEWKARIKEEVNWWLIVH